MSRKLPSDTFCALPWMHLSSRPDGSMRTCCTSNASSVQDPDSNKKVGGGQVGVVKREDGKPANFNTTTLEEWKQSTKSNWTHLTVDDTQQNSPEMSTLAQVWTDFDVGFKIEENTNESNTSARHHPSSYDYNIAHSTGTVIIDHEGNQRIWWGDYDWIIDLVKEDILNLVSEI